MSVGLIPELDSDDQYRLRMQQAAAADAYYGVGGSSRVYPLDSGLVDVQPIIHGSEGEPLALPEKRHLCRAKYVYNPVSGRCQPSLSVRL